MKILIFLLVVSVCCFLSCTAPKDSLSSAKIRVILDTDANNELDDQHAIAYMLFNGDVFDVDGITVNATRNGGDIHEQAAEAERVIKLCNLHPKIPVYKGANSGFEEIKENVQADFDGAEAVNYIIKKAHEQAAHKLVLLPVGKLTNIALALLKDPSIADKVRIVWLGSNYPEPGEYNQNNDEPALNFLLNTKVPLEFAIVRYGKPSGTDAVRVTPAEMQARMPGAGPQISEPVVGRHGGEFTSFGDYSINLFQHIDLHGDPPSRALFDMAAVAIVKNPDWAVPTEIPAPILVDGVWQERPENSRTIVIWENFDKDRILADFMESMQNYVLVE